VFDNAAVRADADTCPELGPGITGKGRAPIRRFYIDTRAINGTTAVLRDDEARHIARVLRLRPGDGISLFDDHGAEYDGMIQSLGARTVEVVLTSRHAPGTRDAGPALVLAQAVLKSDKMDFVIQKCTELGATGFAPFFSARTVPRWTPDASARKCAHWRNIVIAAVKQSGACRPPDVSEPVPFAALMRRHYDGLLKLVLWEREHDMTLKRVLRDRTAQHGIVVAVGPEGGFSEEEISSARSSGFVPVGLGTRTLRAETAAVAALAMICYERLP